MLQKNDFKETNSVSLSNRFGRNNLLFVDPKTKQFVFPKLNQCKLLRMAISCINTKKPTNKIYIEKKKIWDYLGYGQKSKKSRYTFLAKNIALLKTVQIVENTVDLKNNKMVSVFSETSWNDMESFVYFEFDEKAMEYLVCTVEFFFYSIREIRYISHKSTLYLFEYLISEKWKMNIADKYYVSASVEELRNVTLTQNLYRDFIDWKKRVLIPSIKEVNLYTSYIIEEYKTNQYGKSIKSIEFVLRKKKGNEYQQTLFELEGKHGKY